MSGKCYSCATGFGFFNKELGCKNCGFAFCKHCLKKKAPVPKHKNEVHKVCNSCYDILTGKVDPAKKASYSPPEAYKKRIAALNNPQPAKPRPSPGASGGAPNPKKYYPKTMTKEDIAIAERLEKLKESRKQVNLPDEKEIRERLDNIKKPVPPPTTQAENGAPQDAQPAAPNQPATTNQPQGHPPSQPQPPHMGAAAPAAGGSGAQVDEVHRLMTRYTELVNIDQKYTPESGAPSVPPSAYQHAPYHGDPLVNAAKMPNMAGTQEELNALMEATAREAALDAERAMFGDTKDTELRSRLNKLKGEDPGAKPGDRFAGLRGDSDDEEESEEAAAERLIKKMLEMKEIEMGSDTVTNGSDNTAAGAKKEDSETEAMERMLKKMQAMRKMEAEAKPDDKDASSAAKKTKGGSSNEESEMEAMKRMMKKLQEMREEELSAPSARETQAVLDRLEDAPESDPEDQLPWCCICNNDAALRCYGCDGDLYCQRCYKEGHDREDYADHRTKKFAPKTGSPDTSY